MTRNILRYSLKRSAYELLPVSFKRLICLLPFSWLAGPSYRRIMRQDDKFGRAKREQIDAYQSKKLGEMLRFAVEQVPAYHHLENVVQRYSPPDALKRFPFLTKEKLQQKMQDYLPRDFGDIPHYEISTGGTSGNQLTFYVDSDSQAAETAFMHRQWKRVGYTPRARKATFRGVSFPDLEPGVYWQHNPIYNELQFSPFHMNDETLDSYVEMLNRFNPQFIHGYPSAVDILAEYVLRKRCETPDIRAVLLGSEACLPQQRVRIEKAFKTRVFTWYGHSERVVLGGECEKSSVYHQFPDYGYLEIVSPDRGDRVAVGDQGEIVGTGFLNRSLPLIRYRTGDYATKREPYCECGRHWDRFSEVKGRWDQAMILGKTGSKISIAALNMHGPFFEKVVRYQYYQKEPGICEIRIMIAPGFTEKDRGTIKCKYQEKVHGEVDFKVRIVENISLTSAGKLKRLVSEL